MYEYDHLCFIISVQKYVGTLSSPNIRTITTFRIVSATLRGQKNAGNLINIKGKPKDSKTFISLVKNNIQNVITQFGRQMKLAFLESNNHKMTVQKP